MDDLSDSQNSVFITALLLQLLFNLFAFSAIKKPWKGKRQSIEEEFDKLDQDRMLEDISSFLDFTKPNCLVDESKMQAKNLQMQALRDSYKDPFHLLFMSVIDKERKETWVPPQVENTKDVNTLMNHVDLEVIQEET